jgi:hypothetical protein
MRFASWNELIIKISEVKQAIEDKVEIFKEYPTVLAKSISASIHFLPWPFDDIAEAIHDGTQGSEEDKFREVVNYFENLQARGEEHYNKVTLRLENILSQIYDIEPATRSIVRKIQEVLISTAENTDQKLNELENEVNIREIKADETLTAVGTNLRILDKVTDQIGEIVTNQRRPPMWKPYGVSAEQKGNIINLKSGNEVLETITADKLAILSPEDRQLITSYEAAMKSYFDTWTMVYPKLAIESNPITKAQLNQQLKGIAKEMCDNLNKLMDFMMEKGIDLRAHYQHISDICSQSE